MSVIRWIAQATLTTLEAAGRLFWAILLVVVLLCKLLTSIQD